MYFYDMIKDMSDEEIEKHLSYEIRDLESISKLNNNGSDTIGYVLSYNPSMFNIPLNETEMKVPIQVRCFYGGYVPKGMKVVYGFSVDKNCAVSNSGMYYMIDDDSYIYDFCKYIRDQEVYNEVDFFDHVLAFLENYFGNDKRHSRDEMFKMILKSNKTYYDPIKEHKFSDFRGKGNAMCTEYAIMANNILSVFGYDSYVVIGQEKDEKTGLELHAFNFISYTNENYERESALIDFANSVSVFDHKFNKICNSPYIMHLDKFDNEFVDDFICNELHLVNKDYYYVVIGNSLMQLVTDKNRDYYVSSKILVKKMSNERQK